MWNNQVHICIWLQHFFIFDHAEKTLSQILATIRRRQNEWIKLILDLWQYNKSCILLPNISSAKTAKWSFIRIWIAEFQGEICITILEDKIYFIMNDAYELLTWSKSIGESRRTNPKIKRNWFRFWLKQIAILKHVCTSIAKLLNPPLNWLEKNIATGLLYNKWYLSNQVITN